MRLTEEYVKNCMDNNIELRCEKKTVRLINRDEAPIDTYITQCGTVKAQKDSENRLYVLLESEGTFRAYGYIDKEDYQYFEVLNPQFKINKERLKMLIDALAADDYRIKDLVSDISLMLYCNDNCPLRAYCDKKTTDSSKPCSEVVTDWLMGI
jgi:hypothetical protein